jgi:hypothetical protein
VVKDVALQVHARPLSKHSGPQILTRTIVGPWMSIKWLNSGMLATGLAASSRRISASARGEKLLALPEFFPSNHCDCTIHIQTGSLSHLYGRRSSPSPVGTINRPVLTGPPSLVHPSSDSLPVPAFPIGQPPNRASLFLQKLFSGVASQRNWGGNSQQSSWPLFLFQPEFR